MQSAACRRHMLRITASQIRVVGLASEEPHLRFLLRFAEPGASTNIPFFEK